MQAVDGGRAADRYAGRTTRAGGPHGDGPLARRARRGRGAGLRRLPRRLARYLREDYAPRHPERDRGRQPSGTRWPARISLGADIDPAEAYEWGWAELARIEAEMAIEADKVSPGAGPTRPPRCWTRPSDVTGADAYLAWLQDRHDEAVERLDGVLFDIAPPLRRIEAVLARGSSSGAAYYTQAERGPDQARPDLVAARRRGATRTGSRTWSSSPPSSTRACPAITCRRARP